MGVKRFPSETVGFYEREEDSKEFSSAFYDGTLLALRTG
jgi:hypothetical protein